MEMKYEAWPMLMKSGNVKKKTVYRVGKTQFITIFKYYRPNEKEPFRVCERSGWHQYERDLKPRDLALSPDPPFVT